MTKIDEKEMVDIAESEIRKFVKKWKKNPYLWESETDVHAELYNMIKSSIRRPLIKWKYEGYMEKYEKFNWVYCKPKTYIKGEKNCYYPDIVIYKDTGRIQKIGERENEPMLWVCEIKYITNWSSTCSKENVEHDIKKLHSLLEQKNGGTDYARYLILCRCESLSKNVKKVLQNRDKKIRVFRYGIKK